jgi:hypothetical protein
MTGSNKFIFCLIQTYSSPTKVEQNVAINVGIKMLVGLTDPSIARSAIIEMGIMVSPEALSTKNMICAFDAVSLSGFISCSSFIALRPRGVAALSSPRILALKFMMIEPVAGWFLGISGKSLEKKGPTTLESNGTIPPFSPIFIRPNQSDITPASPIEISNPVFAISKVDWSIAGKTVASLKKINLMKATTKAMRKNETQM